MAVTSKVYGLAQQSLANKQIDFDTDTVKVLLCTSGHTPNQDSHQYKSSITNEVVGTGYTAGGQTVTGKTVSYSSATNTLTVSCGAVSWPNSTLTARYAVFYIDTGADATSPLLCFWDFGGDVVSTAGPFDLTVNASGLLTLTAA